MVSELFIFLRRFENFFEFIVGEEQRRADVAERLHEIPALLTVQDVEDCRTFMLEEGERAAYQKMKFSNFNGTVLLHVFVLLLLGGVCSLQTSLYTILCLMSTLNCNYLVLLKTLLLTADTN